MPDRPLGGFLAAVQFLTRVPVPSSRGPSLSRAVVWFPVVGALVGACVGGIAAGLGEVISMTVAAAVAVLTGVLVTGALHEDGLADLADAVAGGWSRERRLEILQDPRHGTYGVAALSGSIVLRVVALGSVGRAAAFGGLIAAHALGRGAAVAVMAWAPLARPDGLGAAYTVAVGRGRATLGGGVAVAIAAVATGWWAGPLAVAAAVPAVVVLAVALRALGGITGDVLGAIEQTAECTVLIVLTALAQHHVIWWT